MCNRYYTIHSLNVIQPQCQRCAQRSMHNTKLTPIPSIPSPPPPPSIALLPSPSSLELVSWFVISVPLFGLSRDAVFHAFGCDCMSDSGSVLIVASSVDSYPGADVPKEPKGWGSGRMIVRSFQGLVTITSPTSATTKVREELGRRGRFRGGEDGCCFY